MGEAMPGAVVTGFGCISAFGAGVPSFARGLERGHPAFADLDLFDASAFRNELAGQVGHIPRPDSYAPRAWTRLDRCDRMALFAMDEALDRAGRPQTGRAGLFCGLGIAGMLEAEDALYAHPQRGLAGVGLRRMMDAVVCSTADLLALQLGCRGPVSTVSTACSSSANAIGQALDAIRRGDVELAIAGGAESLCRLTLAGFNSLGVITQDRPRPFDRRRSGMLLGEGAAFLVLESEAHARARGLEPTLELRGYGCTVEGHHIVHPQRTGEGAARAMRWALDDAAIAPLCVDHVNTHGTATVPNDAMEAAAIAQVLGDRAVPLTATKALIGHALSASGALEAVASLLTLRDGFVAPTPGHAHPDGPGPLDVVHGEARRGRFDVALSNSFAFGGNDVSLVFARKAT
jgi:3-oxoacyl-[acyl-carrier-protein] synthase II